MLAGTIVRRPWPEVCLDSHYSHSQRRDSRVRGVLAPAERGRRFRSRTGLLSRLRQRTRPADSGPRRPRPGEPKQIRTVLHSAAARTTLMASRISRAYTSRQRGRQGRTSGRANCFEHLYRVNRDCSRPAGDQRLHQCGPLARYRIDRVAGRRARRVGDDAEAAVRSQLDTEATGPPAGWNRVADGSRVPAGCMTVDRCSWIPNSKFQIPNS
jgi:hypothetical protein